MTNEPKTSEPAATKPVTIEVLADPVSMMFKVVPVSFSWSIMAPCAGSDEYRYTLTFGTPGLMATLFFCCEEASDSAYRAITHGELDIIRFGNERHLLDAENAASAASSPRVLRPLGLNLLQTEAPWPAKPWQVCVTDKLKEPQRDAINNVVKCSTSIYDDLPSSASIRFSVSGATVPTYQITYEQILHSEACGDHVELSTISDKLPGCIIFCDDEAVAQALHADIQAHEVAHISVNEKVRAVMYVPSPDGETQSLLVDSPHNLTDEMQSLLLDEPSRMLRSFRVMLEGALKYEMVNVVFVNANNLEHSKPKASTSIKLSSFAELRKIV